MVAFKHVGHEDADSFGVTQGTTTITVTGDPGNDETITLVDYAGVSKTITGQPGASVSSTSQRATTTTAANLKAAIEANTTILCSISSNVITVHQRQGGSSGNTAITEDLTNVAVSGNAFTGGTDDEAHDFVYMTDGKRYVKVDMSSTRQSCLNGLAYKTVSNSLAAAISLADGTVQLPCCFTGMTLLPPTGSSPPSLNCLTDSFCWHYVARRRGCGSTGTKFGETGDNIKALIPVGSATFCWLARTLWSFLPTTRCFLMPPSAGSVVRLVSWPRAFANVGEMGVLIASPQGVFGVGLTADVEKFKSVQGQVGPPVCQHRL